MALGLECITTMAGKPGVREIRTILITLLAGIADSLSNLILRIIGFLFLEGISALSLCIIGLIQDLICLTGGILSRSVLRILIFTALLGLDGGMRPRLTSCISMRMAYMASISILTAPGAR